MREIRSKPEEDSTSKVNNFFFKSVQEYVLGYCAKSTSQFQQCMFSSQQSDAPNKLFVMLTSAVSVLSFDLSLTETPQTGTWRLKVLS